MDWASYKALCDQPNVFSRWMLEQCAELFVQQGAVEMSEMLSAVLANASPVEAPADFSAGDHARMFVLEMELADRARAYHLIVEAKRQGLSTRATATRGLGGFSEAWAEYVRWEL